MKRHIETLGLALKRIGEKAKVRKGMLSILAVFFVLQIYFVRELLAAELLFGMGFTVLFCLGLMVYAVGAIGERGLDVAEVGVRAISNSARRGYASLEEISRKPFRHPRSESAQ
jgi:hypothetical protein